MAEPWTTLAAYRDEVLSRTRAVGGPPSAHRTAALAAVRGAGDTAVLDGIASRHDQALTSTDDRPPGGGEENQNHGGDEGEDGGEVVGE